MPLLGTRGAASARGFGLFTRIAAAVDEFFEYVTMLLPGNGTNGAQNNTFLDSSTNNFSLTRNGNPTQGTFSPYGSNWSNYIGTTTDYLTAPDNAVFNLTSGDFTIEAFFYPVSGAGGVLVGKGTAGTYDGYFIYPYPNSNRVDFYASTSGTAWDITLVSASGLVRNTWNHIAVTRSASTWRLFVNGTLAATTTNGSVLIGNSSAVSIGAASTGSQPFGVGYVSNVRIVKGTAVYTAAFTPPTAPLTAITNTSLLTCQSNRFIDNSTNAFTITRNGDVSVQRFSPFSPTAPYAASTDGGSGYFDGSGDYLQTPVSGSLAIGTANFTVEAWVYLNTTSGYGGIVSTAFQGGSDNGLILSFDLGQAGFGIGNGSSVDGVYASSLPQNTWTHVAGTRNGSTLTLFVNGVSVGTATTSRSINTTRAVIGVYYNTAGQYFFNGYISNARIVNSVVYTGNFTPPTAPLTAITNTSLLCNFTNAGIIDNAMMNDLETVGNAQISTAQSKFGGSSMAFPGSSWLRSKVQSNVIGGGDFTIEMFVNFTDTNRAGVIEFALGNSWLEWSINAGAWPISRLVLALSGSFAITSNTPLSTGVFHHVAIVRSGGTVSLYQNGVNVGSASYSDSIGGDGTILVGTALAQPFNGYIDDLRITKGVARYTANFTPPTAPFPLQ